MADTAALLDNPRGCAKRLRTSSMPLLRPLPIRPCFLLLAGLTACAASPAADSGATQAASSTAGTTASSPGTKPPSTSTSASSTTSNPRGSAGTQASSATPTRAGNPGTPTTTGSSGSQASSAPAAAGGNTAAISSNTAGTQAPAANSAGNPPAAGSGSAGTGATTTTNPTNGCQGTLCESFEAFTGDTLDPSWEVSTTNCMGTGKVTVDSTQAHGGKTSIRVNGGAGFCNHVFFRPKPSTWMAVAPVYARFFVRFEKPLTQSHVTFLALHDDAEMKDVRMGGQSEILMWNRESDDATLPELSPTGIAMSIKPETGKWLCVEISVDPQAPKMETWLNGEPVKGLTVEGDPTPDVDAQWQRKANWHPMLSDIRFGWESYGGDENTLWFDDVVLASTRVGCGD